MWMKRIGAALLAAGLVAMAGAQDKVLAPTPPMGWNSWDSSWADGNRGAVSRERRSMVAAEAQEGVWVAESSGG